MTVDSEDEELLGAVASALVTLDELDDLTAFRMPYPAAVQTTLDRLALHCLRRRARPPSSVMGMVRWGYERPLGTWPLVLLADIYPADDLLLDGRSGAPTALCHEIALCAETTNPFLEVSRQVTGMAAFAAERDLALAYRAMRNVLATYPILTNERFNEVRFAGIGALDEYLGQFFVKIEPGFDAGGEIRACDGCGGPLLPADGGNWWCEREECAAEGLVAPGERWDHDTQVFLQGDRRHRQFVSGPGRAVQRLGAKLTLSGARVGYWPMSGPGDLRVTLPGRQARTVNVVDWHSPALLGRAIAASVTGYGIDALCWVVASYRTDADPSYLRIASEHAMSPWIFTEDGFTDMIRCEVKDHA
ncbi:restriction endonuclease-related protein [Amycolatopsis sp. H20-H5]|uniref:pPIWI_RE_Y domain-containing protein n=1 Tax=Amycolatopsis sp. H20-H5 TaxID=3046309 RepID=UPI002DBFC9F4|nr:hypothetical protein [Amycolatopsis sp. H20-H5]MEC3980451.1 hypothetical protein [Amycolatopsis sp. H20-H5]